MTSVVSNVYSAAGQIPLPLDESEVRVIIGQTPSRIHSAALREAARSWLENMHRANHPGMARFMGRPSNRDNFPNRIIGFVGNEGDGSRLGSLQHCLKAYSGGQRLLSPWGTLSGWRCATRALTELDQENWRGAVVWLDLDAMAPTEATLGDMEEIVRMLIYRPPEQVDDRAVDPEARRRNGWEVALNLGNTAAWLPLYHVCDEVWFIERQDPAGLLWETSLASFLRNPFAVDGGRVPEHPGDHDYRYSLHLRSSWMPHRDPGSDRDTDAPAWEIPDPSPDDETYGRTADTPEREIPVPSQDGEAPVDVGVGVDQEGSLAESFAGALEDRLPDLRLKRDRLNRDWVILASMLLCGEK